MLFRKYNADSRYQLALPKRLCSTCANCLDSYIRGDQINSLHLVMKLIWCKARMEKNMLDKKSSCLYFNI